MLSFPNTKPVADTRCSCRVLFGANDYTNLRTIVAQAHPEMPVSLAALGEWMVIKTVFSVQQPLQDIAAQIVTVLGSVPTSIDRQFYQVLGLSIIDETFRSTVNNSNLGFKLSGPDFAAITSLNSNPDFIAKTKVFHDLVWGSDCKAWMFESAGNVKVRHVHPLDPDETDAFAKL
jgi:hypothetical protein